MPSEPPPTPWISTRFTDESLLIDVQPIFGDVTLGDENEGSEWGESSTPQPRHITSEPLSPNTPNRGRVAARKGSNDSLSLGLGDYLPDAEDSEHSYAERNERAEKEEAGSDRGPSNLLSHKREGSQSLLSNINSVKRIKPATKPDSPSDDPFARRSSRSSRRNPSSSTAPSDPLAQLLRPEELDRTQALTSSDPDLRIGTASVRLKQVVRPSAQVSNGVRGLAAGGRIQKHASSSRIPTAAGKAEPQPSALSRYIANSSMLGPDQSDRPTGAHPPMAVTPDNCEEPDTSTNQVLEDTQPLRPAPGSANDLMTKPRSTSVFSLASTVSEASFATSDLSIPSPPQLSAPIITPTSRRESMSEKVVGFFSNLLRSSASSDSLRGNRGNEGSDPIPKQTDQAEEENGDVPSALTSEESEPRGATTEIKVYDTVLLSTKTAQAPTGTSRPVHFLPITRPVPVLSARPIRSDRREMAVSAKQETDSNPARKRDAAQAVKPTRHALAAKPRVPLQLARPQNLSATSNSGLRSSKPLVGKSQDIHAVKDPRGSVTARPLPITTSAFAKAALARLPSPGKGATPSSQRITVKNGERASDLADRKNVFERLAASATSTGTISTTVEQRTGGNGTTSASSSSASVGRMRKTVPVRGHTPGKASTLRAAQRAAFDAAVKEKMEAKERQAEEERLKREKEEEEEYARRRKETVIWAKPVPDMYHRHQRDGERS